MSSVQTLFVWDATTNTVTEIASLVPSTACLKGSCSVIEPPFSPAWSSDGTRLAFLASQTLRIATFDAAPVRTLQSPPVVMVPNSLHWSPDGTRLWFGNNSSILSIPTSGGSAFTTIADFQDGSQVSGFDLSPDGKKMAVTTGAKFYLQDLASSTRTSVDLGSSFPPAWSPNGARVAISSGSVYVVNADASSPTRVTSDTHFSKVVWLPDGISVAYSASQLRGIAIVNVAGGGVQLVAPGAGDFSVSPR